MNKQSYGQIVEQRSDQLKFPIEMRKKDAGTAKLQNMVEDCLVDIFSMSSTNLIDLCSLAETCKRFRSISHIVMRDKFKNLVFNANYFVSWGENGYAGHKSYIFQSAEFLYETRKRSEVERIFRNFGMFLSKVSVGHEESMVGLIDKCCDESLKSLKLQSLEIPSIHAMKLKPKFKRLQTLILWDVSIDADKLIFEGLDSLVELNVTCIEVSSIILENVFPRLERFMYRQFDTISGSDDPSLKKLLTFITSNATMKCLDLQLICNQNCWSLILQAISSCKGLQKLGIIDSSSCHSCSSDLFEPLTALKSLRTMKLLGVSFLDHGEVAILAQLREIFLTGCELSRNDLADIIRQSVNLVRLETDIVMDVGVYTRILDIVKYRLHVLTLECNSTFTDTKRNLNQKVRLNPY